MSSPNPGGDGSELPPPKKPHTDKPSNPPSSTKGTAKRKGNVEEIAAEKRHGRPTSTHHNLIDRITIATGKLASRILLTSTPGTNPPPVTSANEALLQQQLSTAKATNLLEEKDRLHQKALAAVKKRAVDAEGSLITAKDAHQHLLQAAEQRAKDAESEVAAAQRALEVFKSNADSFLDEERARIREGYRSAFQEALNAKQQRLDDAEAELEAARTRAAWDKQDLLTAREETRQAAQDHQKAKGEYKDLKRKSNDRKKLYNRVVIAGNAIAA